MGGRSIPGAGFGSGDDRFHFPQKARRERQRRRCGDAAEALAAEVAAPAEPGCNLERFLGATTPAVEARYLSKTTMSCWRTCSVEYYPYFELGDLWESFREWSVYGTGVNLVLDEGDGVVQYYVPYLSGIQLYGKRRRAPAVESRRLVDDSDGYSTEDSSSCESFDSKLGTIASEAGRSQSHLLFEYFEQDVPYSRVPLVDKISSLITKFPKLKTLKSCDLLPSSWISVAWYPIYRIPTGPTLRDLDACFLTFHSLSTPLEGSQVSMGPVITYPDSDDGKPKITLPVFGLATYKYKGSIWAQSAELQGQLPDSLQQAANNWLRSLQVNHPDFLFFVSNGAFRR